MYFENNEKDKASWKKKEKAIKTHLMLAVIAVVFLAVVLVFFRTQLWAIITGMGIVVGLIVDLLVLINTIKGE